MNKSLVLCCYTCEGQIRSQRYTWGGLYPKVSFKPYGGKSQGSEQNQFPKVLTVLLYGRETWRMTKRNEDKLDSFQHKCLRKILKIHWPMKVTNEEVRERTRSERISTQIKTRRWRWIGHVLRMKPDSLPRTALTWAPEGKRNKRSSERNLEKTS